MNTTLKSDVEQDKVIIEVCWGAGGACPTLSGNVKPPPPLDLEASVIVTTCTHLWETVIQVFKKEKWSLVLLVWVNRISLVFSIRDQRAQVMIFCYAGKPRLKCHQLRITAACAGVLGHSAVIMCTLHQFVPLLLGKERKRHGNGFKHWNTDTVP